MTMLVNMYVFYDKNKDIRAIAPSLNDFSDPECSIAIMPLPAVEDFLTGKKNTFDFQVDKLKTLSGEKHSISRKVTKIDYVRTLDNYLTEIGKPKYGETIISIVNQKSKKTILVEVAQEFKEMYTHGSVEDRDEANDFLKLSSISIHITKRHNPYHLLMSLNFSVRELYSSGALYFNYTNEHGDTSAYAKRIFNGYGYKEKN